MGAYNNILKLQMLFQNSMSAYSDSKVDDDTEVDDEEYFQTLPPHTTFVFSKQSRPSKSRSRSCETKVPLQRTDSTKDGLKELAALLFTEGRVEGKGEIIGGPNRKLNRQELESLTQYDYFCNKPEKPGKTLSKQSSLVENNNASFSMTLAEQICQKLENHSRLMNNKRR